MGISTIRSYRGAKIFEAVGLSEDLLNTYFGTAASSIGGINLEQIAQDYTAFHDAGFLPKEISPLLPNIGQFSYRKDGEQHAGNRQQSVRSSLPHAWAATRSSRNSRNLPTIKKARYSSATSLLSSATR